MDVTEVLLENDRLRAENSRLKEQFTIARIGSAHAIGEKKIHMQEQETFNKESIERINRLAAENVKLRNEYDDYINGRSGSWYIVVLKKERDAARAENVALRERCGEYERALELALGKFNAISDEQDISKASTGAKLMREVLSKHSKLK